MQMYKCARPLHRHSAAQAKPVTGRTVTTLHPHHWTHSSELFPSAFKPIMSCPAHNRHAKWSLFSPCISPQSIHTILLEKIELKTSKWDFLIALLKWGKGICNKEHGKTDMSTQNIHMCIYICLGKTVGKCCPSAYNHCVLRMNNFGFFQERAPNQQ